MEGTHEEPVARIELLDTSEPEEARVPVEDLAVIAEFRDYIYPGLVSTGTVRRGGEKPYHIVINAENFHALEALTFTHRGKLDARLALVLANSSRIKNAARGPTF